MQLHVQAWEPGTAFAAISHVWAQGLGNGSKTEVWTCQIDHIRNLVSKVFDSTPQDDWIDTLALLLELSLKQKATKLMFHVYSQAEHCIIIDRYLLKCNYSASSYTIAVGLRSGG
ncbi:hypothetical protein MANI_002790 [Metarhizium anisopliae]